MGVSRDIVYLEERNVVVVLHGPGVVQFVSDDFLHFDFATEERVRMSARHAQLYGPLGQVVQHFPPVNDDQKGAPEGGGGIRGVKRLAKRR